MQRKGSHHNCLNVAMRVSLVTPRTGLSSGPGGKVSSIYYALPSASEDIIHYPEQGPHPRESQFPWRCSFVLT